MRVSFLQVRKNLYRFGILIGFLLLAYQFFIAFQAFRENVVSLKYLLPLIIAVLLSTLAMFQQIHAWRIIMKALNYSLPVLETQRGYALSFLVRYIPGSFWGYLNRSEWLRQKYNISYSSSNTSSILEILTAVLGCVFAIGISTLLTQRYLLPPVLTFLILPLPLLAWYIIRRLPALKILAPVLQKLQVPQQLGRFRFSYWVAIILLLASNWFYYGMSLYLSGLALGLWSLDLGLQQWFLFSGYFSLSWLIGFLVFFLPSGMGLRELSLSMILVNQTGLLLQEANALAVAMRFVTTVAELNMVLFAVLLYSIGKLLHGPMQPEKIVSGKQEENP
jgi:glycosyltransferase 2 family protein